jgi:hypothetical protein
MQSGDMVRMADSPGLPVHIGIFYRDDQGREFVIHAYTRNGRTGKVRKDEINAERRATFAEAMRFPE